MSERSGERRQCDRLEYSIGTGRIFLDEAIFGLFIIFIYPNSPFVIPNSGVHCVSLTHESLIVDAFLFVVRWSQRQKGDASHSYGRQDFWRCIFSSTLLGDAFCSSSGSPDWWCCCCADLWWQVLCLICSMHHFQFGARQFNQYLFFFFFVQCCTTIIVYTSVSDLTFSLLRKCL